MDLKALEALPTQAEMAAVDEVLGPSGGGWEGGQRHPELEGHSARGGVATAAGRRHLLLPALQAISTRVGWISQGAMGYLCRRLDVPPAEAYGVASFYALFALDPRPPVVAHVCDDIACLGAGAAHLCEALEGALGPEGETPHGGAAGNGAAHNGGRPGAGGSTWARSPCLGQCDRAPAALVVGAGTRPVERVLTTTSAAEVVGALAEVAAEVGSPAGSTPAPPAPARPRARIPQADAGERSSLRLLRRVGVVDPTSLDDYRAHGGYQSLRRAFALGPAGVIAEVSESNLAGRGGAAFPTGRKWDAVARAPRRPHYLVCNADESEPGTFKDRVLMEEDPFAVIEAMTVAGYATGCTQGYVYIRGEYPLATGRLEAALDQARSRGFLGPDVMGEGYAFDIEVRRGAGAYICGEETALFNSLEGFRGEPRNKPPFPAEAGLFGRPTVVNNVETLVNVLDILSEGAAAFARVGTAASTGTRLFCLAGNVSRPGLYEVAHGTTLGSLLELAGGVAGGRPLQAVLLGGAAGAFVGPESLDLPLSFEATRAAGVTLGSGVVMVFDDRVDLGVICLRIARFFRDESCGQCVPCRVGTARQEELLHRLVTGRPIASVESELATLDELGAVMRDASICGLGQTAAGAIASAVGRFGLFANGSTRT